MKKRIEENLVFENSRIMYPNFSGKESEYNRAGDRNFCIVIDDMETAQALANDGWLVKIRPPKEEGGSPLAYMEVKVDYRKKAPSIFMVVDGVTTPLDEATVGELDHLEIRSVDLVINPYNWVLQPGTRNERSGVKAYCKTLYVNIIPDPFAGKYNRNGSLPF